MITVCEPLVRGETHVCFNAALLEVLREAFPQEELAFFGASSHIAALQKQVGPRTLSSVAWTPVVLPGQQQRGLDALRTIKFIQRLLDTLNRDERKDLVLTNIKPSILLALKVLEGMARKRRIGVQVVIHGQIGGINGRRSRHPIRRLRGMRTALQLFGRGNIRYLVLEKGIRDALLKSIPSLAEQVDILDHPLPPNEGERATIPLSLPIRFGFVGLANQNKGFPVFVRLASQMTERYRDQVEFHAVGRLQNDRLRSGELEALATKPAVRRLDRDSFLRGIRHLHFVVLPLQPEYYESVASGSLLDAIAFEKPIIATNIPLFANLFEEFGQFGYLYDAESDLRNAVENILLDIDQERYIEQVRNIRKVKAARTPQSLAEVYRAIRARGLNFRCGSLSTTPSGVHF
jgi:glycosyltransferase involved in cell wall biosynthesis